MTDASGGAETVTRAFRVAYDGRKYAGFQRQPHAHTVADALLGALADHGIVDPGDGPTHATPPGYAAAGRTDAGVSAVAQTVAFEAPAWLTPRAFNGHLPGAVRAWAAADVASGFHATHDAVRRTYRYHLYAPDAGASGTPESARRDPEHAVDDERLRAALARFDGEHDFHNLTTDETGTVRDLDARATRSSSRSRPAASRARSSAGSSPRLGPSVAVLPSRSGSTACSLPSRSRATAASAPRRPNRSCCGT